MASDYGFRVRPKGLLQRPVFLIGLVVAAAVGALIQAGFAARERALGLSVARDWTVSGPPCARASDAAGLPRWPRAEKVSDFDGVGFTRAAGYMTCQRISYQRGRRVAAFPVCQFSSPGALIVTVDGVASYFVPPPGARATVAVRDGVPSCVLAAPAWPTVAELNAAGR